MRKWECQAGQRLAVNGCLLHSHFSLSAFQLFPYAPRLGPTRKSQHPHLREQRPADILTPPSRVWRAAVSDLPFDPVLVSVAE